VRRRAVQVSARRGAVSSWQEEKVRVNRAGECLTTMREPAQQRMRASAGKRGRRVSAEAGGAAGAICGSVLPRLKCPGRSSRARLWAVCVCGKCVQV